MRSASGRTIPARSLWRIWKAVSHAVRIARQAIELLETSHITFPRPEAEHLLAIKTGRLPYKEVADEIDRLLPEVEIAAAASRLPDQADEAWIEELIVDQYLGAIQAWRRT